MRVGFGGGARINAVQPDGTRSAMTRRIDDLMALASSRGSPGGGGAIVRRRGPDRPSAGAVEGAAGPLSATNSPSGDDGPWRRSRMRRLTNVRQTMATNTPSPMM